MADDRNKTLYIGAAVAAVAVAAGVYFYKQRFGTEAPLAPPVVAPQAPAAPSDTIRHPLPAADADEEPLPSLEQSDPAARDALSGTFGDAILQFIVPERFIRNFVATLDNLPRAKLAPRVNPVKPIGGEFAVRTTGDATALSPDNYQRYAPLLKLFQDTETQKLVDTYIRFYPLLQTAYQDLGYPDRYFNDRVIEVIDHLLAAPEPRPPIALQQPKVFYEFADPRLESLSAGQKVLLRMGHEQAQAVKAKLRDIRGRIAKAPAG